MKDLERQYRSLLPSKSYGGIRVDGKSFSKTATVLKGPLIALAIWALMLAGVVPAHARETVTVLHVFLAAGQSNMSGRGLPAGGSEDPEDPRIFQYGAKKRTFRAATVPLDMHDIATGLSPATSFARNYLADKPANVGVLIIPAAHGQTGFSRAAGTLTWSAGAASAPEFDLPALAVTQTLKGIAAAQAAGYAVELDGILWHQGENNTAMSTAGYSAELDRLIGYFRDRLGAPELPFVVGEMAPEGIATIPGRENADRSHLETPSRVPFTGFAPSMDGGVNPGEVTHFSRTGIEYLGKNYLSAYLRAAAPSTVSSPTAPVPAIDGAAKVGSVLTAVPGTWGPAPVRLTYRWYRSHLPISGATAPRYHVRTADLGRTITVKVTAARTGHPAVSKTSAGTALVAKGSLNAPVPAITGAAKVGATLTAVPGAWGPAPVALTYRWYRSRIAVSGDTGATYKVCSGDLGRTITVKVTGAKPSYSTTAKISAGTKVGSLALVP